MHSFSINYKIVSVTVLIFMFMFFIGHVVSADDGHPHDEESSAPAGLMLMAPKPGETHHFEVKPETLDGQRIPYMSVSVTAVLKGSGDVIEKELHPMFGGGLHYGVNIALPGEEYTLKFHLEPPSSELARGDSRKDQWLNSLDFEFDFNAKEEFDHKIDIGKASLADMNIFFESEHAESMWMNMAGGMDMDGDMQADDKNTQKTPLLHAFVGLFVGLILGFLFWGRVKKTNALV